MAPAAYTLWTSYLRHNPRNPKWLNRDRFVLSAGHGCMLLYSLLHLTGYDLSLEEIQRFRQWGSKTPGHPEYGDTPGVELTTGRVFAAGKHGVISVFDTMSGTATNSGIQISHLARRTAKRSTWQAPRKSKRMAG